MDAIKVYIAHFYGDFFPKWLRLYARKSGKSGALASQWTVTV